MKYEIIVISVGGSLIVPDEIDAAWLSSLKELILSYTKKGYKFIIICGGGRTARKYQEVAKKLGSGNENLDWIGIKTTALNASLVRAIFGREAYKEIIANPTEKINFKEKILIAGGWKPGCSTDYDAVLLAKNFEIKKLINLTNIDYVYNKDPKKYNDAKAIKRISWINFRKIVGNKWIPGLNMPFDPIASKEAEKLKLEVAIINGKKIKNIKNYIDGKDFIGTLIK